MVGCNHTIDLYKEPQGFFSLRQAAQTHRAVARLSKDRWWGPTYSNYCRNMFIMARDCRRTRENHGPGRISHRQMWLQHHTFRLNFEAYQRLWNGGTSPVLEDSGFLTSPVCSLSPKVVNQCSKNFERNGWIHGLERHDQSCFRTLTTQK